jgi:hypothetical protein
MHTDGQRKREKRKEDVKEDMNKHEQRELGRGRWEE